MNNKTVSCDHCSRKFKTKRALAQHKMAVAQMPRSNRRSSSKPQGVGLSRVARVTTSKTDVANLSGTDRIGYVTSINTYKADKIIFEALITPGIFPRLEAVSQAFQKIKFLKLSFKIVPQVSTMTSGGFVAAFIRDPADSTPTNIVDHLMSQQGAKAAKWWDMVTLDPKVPAVELFTSQSSEVRTYSPGKLIVAVTGQSSQTGDLQVYCDWKVTLSQASLEKPTQVEAPSMAKDNIYTQTGKQDIAVKKGNSYSYAWDDIVTRPEITKYRLPFPLAIQDGTGDNAFAVRQAWYLVKSGNNATLAFQKPEDKWTNNALDEVLLIPKGTVLIPLETNPAGFSTTPSSHAMGSGERKVVRQRELSETSEFSLIANSRSRRSSESSCLDLQNIQQPLSSEFLSSLMSLLDRLRPLVESSSNNQEEPSGLVQKH